MMARAWVNGELLEHLVRIDIAGCDVVRVS